MLNSLTGEFKKILGTENVLQDPADLICYSYDSSPYESIPGTVLFVKNTEQIQKIIYLCLNEKIPVYSRGAGTGTTGASVPLKNGVSVVFTKMNSIHGFNQENLMIDVEPGVITGDIHNFVESKGFFYPPDPSSLKFCTIGGNVMTNAGGPRGVKYGVTRDYVVSLEVITGKGEIIRTSAKTAKNASGYNLTQLFVGSEGTLGLVSGITLKVIPKPRMTLTLMSEFPGINQAMQGILNIFKNGVLPCCIEYLDANCVNLIRNRKESAETLIISEVDGFEESINTQLSLVEKSFKDAGCNNIIIAKNNEERDEIWRVRRGLSPAIKKLGYSGKISEDICVPRHNLPAITDKISEISLKFDIKIICFGHAGDGNLHVNFLFDKNNADEVSKTHRAIEELIENTIMLGGAISGEHGIGLSKRDFLKMAVGEVNYNIMKEIKKIFDPEGILNPGKVFI